MSAPHDDEPATPAPPEARLERIEEEPRCDACGSVLPPLDDDDDGFAVPGVGVYVWTRGEDVRFEKAPLCAGCASAIGITALARWEIEEEEG